MSELCGEIYNLNPLTRTACSLCERSLPNSIARLPHGLRQCESRPACQSCGADHDYLKLCWGVGILLSSGVVKATLKLPETSDWAWKVCLNRPAASSRAPVNSHGLHRRFRSSFNGSGSFRSSSLSTTLLRARGGSFVRADSMMRQSLSVG